MYKKILIFLFILTGLNSCGFSPIYTDNSNKNFNIQIIEKSGDRDSNNFIELNLKNYLNDKNENKFVLKIYTEVQKDSIAKDTSGKTTDYELEVISNFQITYKDNVKNVKITESFSYKSIDDKLTELNYEKSIKKNISSIIVQKLLSHLSRIK
tara:strand:- start:558 stop:1016 length:459 start_codon:yes stop_codon:yes gene_type:complete